MSNECNERYLINNWTHPCWVWGGKQQQATLWAKLEVCIRLKVGDWPQNTHRDVNNLMIVSIVDNHKQTNNLSINGTNQKHYRRRRQKPTNDEDYHISVFSSLKLVTSFRFEERQTRKKIHWDDIDSPASQPIVVNSLMSTQTKTRDTA